MSSLLPPNATKQEVAFAEVMARTSAVPVPFAEALDPMRTSEEMLPWLAWWFSVDAWGTDWPTYVRRRTVQQSLRIHRRKGTVGALLDAIDAIGVPVEIEEWHQRNPKGAPYTFRALVDAVSTPFQEKDLQRLLQAIEDNKNLRSHMTELVPGLSSYANPFVGGLTSIGTDRQVQARFQDISLLLAAMEEGDQVIADSVDRLHTHLNFTMPDRAKEQP